MDVELFMLILEEIALWTQCGCFMYLVGCTLERQVPRFGDILVSSVAGGLMIPYVLYYFVTKALRERRQ